MARNEFVNAFLQRVAGLDDHDYCRIADHVATFRVDYLTRVEEDDAVRDRGIHMQRAGLAGLRKHLDHAWQVKVRQVSFKSRVLAAKHLRRLEALVVTAQ